MGHHGLAMSVIAESAAEIERLRSTRSAGFVDAVRRFYEPFDECGRALRQGDDHAIGVALEFLEADPRCYRSGYMKADLMHALTRRPIPDVYRDRIQTVVLHRIRNLEPRLWRHTVRLAAAVWDETLDRRLDVLVTEGVLAERASDLREGIRHLMETDAGCDPR